MNLAARKLSVWLQNQNMKRGDFADRIGVSQPTLSKILRARRRPTLEVADRIFDETRAFVTPKDWVTPIEEECEAGQAA